MGPSSLKAVFYHRIVASQRCKGLFQAHRYRLEYLIAETDAASCHLMEYLSVNLEYRTHPAGDEELKAWNTKHLGVLRATT